MKKSNVWCKGAAFFPNGKEKHRNFKKKVGLPTNSRVKES
jgi:hypothetical protein